MDGLMDVDGFILSHRRRLAEEKSRLEKERKPRNIVPSNSSAQLRSSRLRKEREEELQHHLEDVKNRKSVAEIRRNLSRARESEIKSNEARLAEDHRRNQDFSEEREYWKKRLAEESRNRENSQALSEVPRNLSHARESERSNEAKQSEGYRKSHEFKDRQYWDKRLAEERRYREGAQGLFPDHGQEARTSTNSVKFEKDRKGAKRSTWDEQEQELMNWTRRQARSPTNHSLAASRRKAQTPPAVDSPRIDKESSKASLRSVSAPSVAAAALTGIAALGVAEDPATKRMRQMKYAEELRNQMKEKGEKWRGNARRSQQERANRHSNVTDRSHRSKYHDSERVTDGSGDEQSQGHRDSRDVRSHRRSSPYHPKRSVEYSDEEDDRVHRKPSKRASDRHGGRYSYYQDPYGPPPPPPPPPPRFHGGGYNQWAYPYHHPPPHGAAYDTPYADIYFPPYAGNPYAPPHPPPGPRGSRPPSSQAYWESRKRSERDSRVTEEERRHHSPKRQMSETEPEVAPFLGLGDPGGKTAKSDKDSYRQELKMQIQEKKERDMKEKAAKERYEQRMESEIYDPFGKGGCGAPVRDQFGNLVADLKQMRKINENRLSGNSPINLKLIKDSPRENAAATPLDFPDTASPRNTILTYDKQTIEEVKKASQENYRDYLRQQVKEKEEMKQREKERQRIEEEKELEQLERDRKRLQEEYQQELERQRRKEEEARSKNEAIKREAELKRQMAIMQAQREELERKALAEEKRFSDIANASNPTIVQRPDSPPVPALRKTKQLSNPPPPHESTSEQRNFRSSSPPVPALRKKQARIQQQQDPAEPAESRPDHSRQASTDFRTVRRPEVSAAQNQRQESRVIDRAEEIPPPPHEPAPRPIAPVARGSISSEVEQKKLLTQLGAIRLHLQAELAKQASQQQHLQEHHSDIFEKAKKQKPKIAGPRRLKYAPSNQHSGRFQKQYPDTPDSSNSSETQQGALFRYQQEIVERGLVKGDPPAMRSPLLSAETDHVDSNTRAAMGGDEDSQMSIGGCSLEGAAESAHVMQQPVLGGHWKDSESRFSLNTQDLDSMAARNEERLQRLEAILNAGVGRSMSESNENYLPPHLRKNAVGSRQSDRSLECEVQHLPAT